MMDSEFKKSISNIPNTLTIMRLASIPLILVCLLFEGRVGSFLGGFFFTAASVTDILDGYVARKYDSVTVLGKFLDPLADKLLISMTMIMLIPLGRIPFWVVMVIVAREMAVTGLRGIAVTEGIVLQASPLGKFKTIFQSVALAGLCLHYEYLGLVDTHVVGMFFLWCALLLTLWSGYDYFSQFSHVLHKKT